MQTRRTALGLGLTLPGLAALAACGPNTGGAGGSGNGDGGGSGSLRFTWWGNPARNERTQNVIAAFNEEVNSDLTISEEPGDWGSYWDRLATQVAGGDAPDIIQMDEKFISEYGNRGVLLDLHEAGLDTSNFASGTVEVGELPDHGLVAVNAGINAPALLANPEVFEQAGVEIPDDASWTWDELIEVAKEVQANSDSGIVGATQLGLQQMICQLFLRQQGQDQFDDGQVGFDAETAVSFYEFAKKLQDESAGPEAALAVEDSGSSLDQSLFATGRAGLGVAWANQLVAYDEALGGNLVVLRPPSMAGNVADAQLWFKASMLWSVSANTADPEGAVQFIDFMVNNPEAGRILGVERGVPANTEVREAAEPELDESAMKVVDYLDLIEPDLGEVAPIVPQGGGEFEDILQRTMEPVLFGNQTPEQGAEALFNEINSAVV